MKTKARKPIYVSDEVDGNVDLAVATFQVRKQIVKWQNSQSDTHLQQLKEHKEYKIEIKPNTRKLIQLVEPPSAQCATKPFTWELTKTMVSKYLIRYAM